MGAAIDFLTARGFSARVSGKRLVVSPASRLTDDVRRYVKAHRLELLAELAANDGIERRCHWRVQIPGCPPFDMIGEPCTHTEAQAHAHGIWPGSEVLP